MSLEYNLETPFSLTSLSAAHKFNISRGFHIWITICSRKSKDREEARVIGTSEILLKKSQLSTFIDLHSKLRAENGKLAHQSSVLFTLHFPSFSLS